MTKEILDLSEQAGLAHFNEVDINGEVKTIAHIKMGAGTEEILKFAELLVRECATVADCPSSFQHTTGYKILKHFNMKETA